MPYQIHSVHSRHPDIGYHHVRFQLAHHFQGSNSVPCFPCDFHICLLAVNQAFYQQNNINLIVSNQNLQQTRPSPDHYPFLAARVDAYPSSATANRMKIPMTT